MRVERSANTASLLDVLDRVLDKGIVIDAWVRLSLVGIELVTLEARVIVASFSTYLGYAGALSELEQPLGTVKTRIRLALARLREVVTPP